MDCVLPHTDLYEISNWKVCILFADGSETRAACAFEEAVAPNALMRGSCGVFDLIFEKLATGVRAAQCVALVCVCVGLLQCCRDVRRLRTPCALLHGLQRVSCGPECRA